MTNASCRHRITHRMREERRAARPLPAIEDFEEKFRRAFGREMTGEERRFFELAGIVLQGEEDEDLAEGQCA